MVAIVLLPGMDGTGDMFTGFASALDGNLKQIVVSYPRSLALGYAELEDFARSCLPKGEPFILLAECFSGPIGISIAASRPPGLIGLVLCCSYARNPAPMFRPLKQFTGLIPVAGWLAEVFAPLLLGRFSSPNLRAALKKSLDSVPAATIRARLRAVLTIDVSSKLREVRVPVLYVRASQDRIVLSHATRHVVETGRSVELVTIAGPHLLLQTRPSEVAKTVEQFASRVATTFTRGDENEVSQNVSLPSRH